MADNVESSATKCANTVISAGSGVENGKHLDKTDKCIEQETNSVDNTVPLKNETENEKNVSETSNGDAKAESVASGDENLAKINDSQQNEYHPETDVVVSPTKTEECVGAIQSSPAKCQKKPLDTENGVSHPDEPDVKKLKKSNEEDSVSVACDVSAIETVCVDEIANGKAAVNTEN